MISSGRRRIGLTVADQAVSSASNFFTGLAIARLSGPSEFGRYMVVLTIWLVVVGLHRSLITDGMIVTSGVAGTPAPLVGEGLAAELVLAAGASATVGSAGLATVISGSSAGLLILAMAPWLASLLVQDFWRAMAFQRRQPGFALANDLVFAAVQVAAIGLFVRLGWRSAPWMIAAWGVGATAGALLGAWPTMSIAHPLRGWRLMRGLWPISRWILADYMTNFASAQAYLACAFFLVSRTDYGGLRAAFNLMGPSVVIVHAGANFGLPEASRLTDPRDRGPLRRYARRLSSGTFVCIAGFGAVVAAGGGRLLAAIYGPAFSRFGPLVLLAAVQSATMVTVFGQTIALKAASRMHRLWQARLVVTTTSLASMIVLVRALGATGAAWAGVVTGISYAVTIHLIYRHELGRPALLRTSPAAKAGSLSEGVP